MRWVFSDGGTGWNGRLRLREAIISLIRKGQSEGGIWRRESTIQEAGVEPGAGERVWAEDGDLWVIVKAMD